MLFLFCFVFICYSGNDSRGIYFFFSVRAILWLVFVRFFVVAVVDNDNNDDDGDDDNVVVVADILILTTTFF